MKNGILITLLLSTWLCATAAEIDLTNQRVILESEDQDKIVTTPADMVLESIIPPNGESIESIVTGTMQCDAPKCRINVAVFTNKSRRYSIVATIPHGPVAFTLTR